MTSAKVTYEMAASGLGTGEAAPALPPHMALPKRRPSMQAEFSGWLSGLVSPGHNRDRSRSVDSRNGNSEDKPSAFRTLARSSTRGAPGMQSVCLCDNLVKK